MIIWKAEVRAENANKFKIKINKPKPQAVLSTNWKIHRFQVIAFTRTVKLTEANYWATQYTHVDRERAGMTQTERWQNMELSTSLDHWVVRKVKTSGKSWKLNGKFQRRPQRGNKNYFTRGWIMLWKLICALNLPKYLSSQVSREWKLGCSAKVTVPAHG